MGDITGANSMVMESGITAEIINSVVDSCPLNCSSLEEIVALKCNRYKALIFDSEVGGQNPLRSASSASPSASPPLKGSSHLDGNNGEGCLCPTTPSPKKEAVEISSSDQTEEDCETPTGRLFDPFAPGPEKFSVAPKKQTLREIKVPVRRQLNFDVCDLNEKMESAMSDDEDDILESVCKSFLELIISSQAQESHSEDLVEDDTPDRFKTPTSVPILMDIAETCPDAPVRPVLKSRKLDQSICRKLEFSSYLV